MPLARYFFFVGGVLLALLFIADACLPKLPAANTASTDRPVIRIHSDRKWPPPVVYDTRLPTITPTQIAKTDAGLPAPATVAGVPAKAPAREAFAQLQPSDVQQLRQSEPRKAEPKLQRPRKIAKRSAGPPMILVARQPQSGWFGTSIW